MNEDALLKKCLAFLPQNDRVIVPPGDDCAVLNTASGYEIVTADPVIEGIHFLPETPPDIVAKKLMRRNLSDIAAMGGTPRYAILTIAINKRDTERYLELFFKSIGEDSYLFQTPIVGGDVTILPYDGIVASLFISGESSQYTQGLRSGAKVGDSIAVTGSLGNSFLSQHHLHFKPRLIEGKALVESGALHAMMDISDGLLMDLNRICKASNCGAMLNLNSLPLRDGASIQNALYDGEDYELLFTFDPAQADKIKIDYTIIGQVTKDLQIIDQLGTVLLTTGWDPFSKN